MKRHVNPLTLKSKIGDAWNNTRDDEALDLLLAQELESIDPYEEASIMQDLSLGAMFDLRMHPQPTFESFVRQMGACDSSEIRVVHLSGHGDSKNGFWWLKEGSKSEFDLKSPEEVADVIALHVDGGPTQTSVECVVLNACQSYGMGRRLFELGVRNVVCWEGKVRDTTAITFSRYFYESLNEMAGRKEIDYRRTFERACLRYSSSSESDPTITVRSRVRNSKRGKLDQIVMICRGNFEQVFVSPLLTCLQVEIVNEIFQSNPLTLDYISIRSCFLLFIISDKVFAQKQLPLEELGPADISSFSPLASILTEDLEDNGCCYL